jgi:hypothetical protein
MSPKPTRHAIDRYAERVLGRDPTSLSEGERSLIAAEVARAACLPKPFAGFKSWRKRGPVASFVVVDGHVLTVLGPGERFTDRSLASVERRSP